MTDRFSRHLIEHRNVERRTRISFIALPCVSMCTALLIAACCTCKDSTAEATSGAPPFSIELSSAGGFSGMMDGYLLKSNGQLFLLSGMPSEKRDAAILGSVDPSVIAELMELAHRDGIGEQPFHKTGNMTTTIRITEDENVSSISWPGLLGEKSAVPEPVKAFYTRILEIVAPFLPKHEEK